MNRKGFMMAEVVVVSAIVLMTLTTLYVSYNKIYTTYQRRINYYDITSLYRLGFYRNMLLNNFDKNNMQLLINSVLDEMKDENKIVLNISEDVLSRSVFEENTGEYKQLDTVYLVRDPSNNLHSDNFKSYNINLSFSEYIDFLNKSLIIDSNYLMIMERCFYMKDKDGKVTNEVNIDNCKYAYLELYDGYEVS